MQEIQHTITYKEYDGIDELPEEDQILVLKARESTSSSYSPYSHFKVGAALLLENGKIITGSNQENAAFPVSLCAERVALFAAQSQYPQSAVVSLAISARSEKMKVENPVTPCGSCRQAIAETEKRFSKAVRLILSGESGKIKIFDSIDHLLPFSFSGDDLSINH